MAIKIYDNGKGLDKAQLENLFSDARKQNESEFDSTGLGLQNVKTYLQQIQGGLL